MRATSSTWLAYSLTGPGSTPVPPLGVVLDLANALQLSTPMTADATGYAQWDLPVPSAAQRLTVWFQGLQASQTTDLFQTTIL